MSILSIDLHSLKTMIKLSFHFQNATYELRDDINFSKFSTGCKLDVGCPVVIAAAIPDAMLLPTDDFFTGGSRAYIRPPNMSQICSMGFKFGLMAGQGTEVTASLWR